VLSLERNLQHGKSVLLSILKEKCVSLGCSTGRNLIHAWRHMNTFRPERSLVQYAFVMERVVRIFCCINEDVCCFVFEGENHIVIRCQVCPHEFGAALERSFRVILFGAGFPRAWLRCVPAWKQLHGCRSSGFWCMQTWKLVAN
jgi:hypothetical protein